jgi:hypothetical protein
MIERTQDKPARITGAAPAPSEELSYRIELWSSANPGARERVLARAFSATLAQAIYKAARIEHPERRITLAQGETLLADSAKA